MDPVRVFSKAEDLRLPLSPRAIAGAFTEWEGRENSPGVLTSGFPGKRDCFIYQMKTRSQDALKVTMGNWLNLELNTSPSACFAQLGTQPLD